MKDPIGAFETIKENFIRYVETAFGTKFESIEKERYALLNYDKVLYRKPWIEVLPDYISSNKHIEDLTLEDLGNALNRIEKNTFKALVQTGLFPSYAKLHSHQAEMLKESLKGNNCIITSGTGSGKTESFLLPLFAQLSKELSNWSAPGTKPESVDNWWKDTTQGGLTQAQIVNANDFSLANNVRQRHHETRPSGVRALILYPMNALVEDQMSRLRKALDSDDTRAWLNENAKGNAIFFGRYNGSSPVAGELRRIKTDGTSTINKSKVEQLTAQLKQMEKDAERVAQYIRQERRTADEAKELKSFFQRLDGSEMRCRFDMQLAPPDILITNYSMLSIMLMRAVDSGIFERTKSWLACSDLPEEQREAEKKNRIFHLIIDELHLYRGTQGTEVAYLLKLVLNRLGLHPHHDQLRILASSASLEAGDNEEGKKSKKFLEDFFGIDSDIKPFKIIEGKNNIVHSLSETERKLPTGPFIKIAEAYDTVKGNITHDNFIDICENSAKNLEGIYKIDRRSTGIERLLNAISNPALKLKERLYNACEISDNDKIAYKAVCSIKADGDDNNNPCFADTIFNSVISYEELQMALRGLLIVRAMLDEPRFKIIADIIPDQRKLPRYRFHYFFRNIEGMWASIKSDDVEVKFADKERTAGKLYSTTRINSENGYRVLELLYCDNCGTTLFGGSRLITRNASGISSFELLPISPNIEGIPEKTPAKLVERRSFQEYAVFWPCGNQQFTPHDKEHGIPANYWRQVTLNGYNQIDFEARWVPASLNNLSGDIEFGSSGHEKSDEIPNDWIKGYYFTIINSSGRDIALPDANGEISADETHKALPNVCPCCGVNHQNRRQDRPKRKFTSIRGFRTGFAKTTQMFAKELMYQLPNSEAERKLVVFSDSREDAAQIANGIERNHFTDLLREILVDELHKKVLTKHNILKAYEADELDKIEGFKVRSSSEVEEVEGLISLSALPGSLPLIVEQRNNAKKQVEKIRQKIFSVRELVDITNSVNLAPLIRHFIELGINPGGNDIAIQSRLLNSKFAPWYELIDFTSFKWQAGADQAFIYNLKEGTFSNLASMFFGSLFYSFESSALGFVTINPDLQSISQEANTLAMRQQDLLQIINSTIRILGDKFKHDKVEDSDPFNLIDYTRFPSQVRRYIRAVANRLSKSETELGNSIFSILSSSGLLDGANGIIIEELFIKVATRTDNVWTSLRGNRPHLHFSGGICTYSLTPLNTQPDKVCSDVWKKNYLSYNAIEEQRSPIRLHCEELTGQTDDQFERQRHFRNIILPDEGYKQVKTIDLLSVTTTLEVGVDIGALQAVMLGNMPPQRFNYQQRVGRAGRRGQAYSVVLTFCRGRSHDEFYFSNPHKITGDAPPTPFLTMGQERIFKRLLSKEILRRIYLTIQPNVNNNEGKSSVHGEFGTVDNWIDYKTQIINWIRSSSKQVEEVVDALLTQELKPNRDKFINWVCDITSNDGLIEKIQTVVYNEEISTNDISEKLAEGGVLPMFGMPTTVKNLYHGINQHLETLTIDRAQSMAIYEFAPGSQKTKDKAIHQVIGFTTEIKNKLNQFGNHNWDGNPFSINKWMSRCRSCGAFKTYNSNNEVNDALLACQNCGEQGDSYQRPVILKAPKAYRTNLSQGSDMRDDSEIILSRPPIFAETNREDSKIDFTKTGNAIISISDRDITWRVNTNSDRFFSGRLYEIRNGFPFGLSQGYKFVNQWIVDEFANNYSDNNGYAMNLQMVLNSVVSETICIGNHKNTEILRIVPASVPLELDLNMFSMDSEPHFVKAQANGVRSGYYSAAFLLQRILADKLDVDPAEIEIADISMKSLDDETGRKVAEIILTDELPNGSGFVRYLYNNFQEVLNEAMLPANPNSYLGKIHLHKHQENCKDACYECLKVYRNMNYHSLLDWRLGFSLLRTFNDAQYVCGTDNNFNNYIELNGWPEFATKLRDNFFESFSFRKKLKGEINGLPLIKFGKNHENVILIIHPYWDLKNMRVANWLTEIVYELREYTNNLDGNLNFIDSFNLHRRPGWCYEKLGSRL
ncbi:hypothetical protein AHMF7605_20980 [Adhaeribacter arboris]|uniref:DEAD/DEAH box helicase n=1 Tax=Adhaeribacter arboris TaxID=2072846 RepID=A0A2T2YK02_9BACT|nr:DEAD/DEAH box helicase [Adhaeribacter arboris]PSR55795.1 hypothetical protein AHMF7605_20980 [Adhaeribacter arboris]